MSDAPGLPASMPDLSQCPGLPLGDGDNDTPVFAEPWQAQAFAMTLQLHERGLFTWPEWAAALSAQIQAAPPADALPPGQLDHAQIYWQQWLAALEQLVAAKGAGTTLALQRMADAWASAALRTPHGQAITLLPGDHAP